MQNLPISGRLIKEKALEFSQKLGQPNLRRGISNKKACGQSSDVTKRKKDTLPHLLEDYQESDVFNTDETGLFFKWLPNTLTFKNQKSHGVKHSKQRVTLLICTNMDGSKKFKLPLDYKANPKAWMT